MSVSNSFASITASVGQGQMAVSETPPRTATGNSLHGTVQTAKPHVRTQVDARQLGCGAMIRIGFRWLAGKAKDIFGKKEDPGEMEAPAAKLPTRGEGLRGTFGSQGPVVPDAEDPLEVENWGKSPAREPAAEQSAEILRGENSEVEDAPDGAIPAEKTPTKGSVRSFRDDGGPDAPAAKASPRDGAELRQDAEEKLQKETEERRCREDANEPLAGTGPAPQQNTASHGEAQEGQEKGPANKATGGRVAVPPFGAPTANIPSARTAAFEVKTAQNTPLPHMRHGPFKEVGTNVPHAASSAASGAEIAREAPLST
jgi:hypothetical protein